MNTVSDTWKGELVRWAIITCHVLSVLNPDSAIKNSHCSCRGPEFGFQHASWMAHNCPELQPPGIQYLLAFSGICTLVPVPTNMHTQTHIKYHFPKDGDQSWPGMSLGLVLVCSTVTRSVFSWPRSANLINYSSPGVCQSTCYSSNV